MLEDCCARFLNHFHDPMYQSPSWLHAGLTANRPFPIPAPLGDSSIRWSQLDEDRQGWSWNATRSYFLTALTAPTAAARNSALAATFRGLGQLVHFVQDAASPGHTRNDAHVRYNYESLIRDVQTGVSGEQHLFTAMLNSAVLPDPAWRSVSVPGYVPIAALIDADRYNGGNPTVTLTSPIGLAEYTNANMFSEDTIFGRSDIVFRSYPFPGPTSVTQQDDDVRLGDGTLVKRRYYMKVGDGDTGYRVATVGFLRDYLDRYPGLINSARLDQKPALDEHVYKDYGSRLVPRAVGYSAALIDYFFRGRLQGDVVPVPSNPARVRFVGTNLSPEALDGGTLDVYAERPSGERVRLTPLAPASTTVFAEPNAFFQSEDFVTVNDAVRYVAVYQGKLGGELPGPDPQRVPGAVIGKVTGTLRVEEIFTDGAAWFARSPSTVFAMPVSVTDYSEVRWGDAEDLVVALTWQGPAEPNQVVTFHLRRMEGSVEPVTVPGPTGPQGQLAERERVAIPLGISLGTTVTLNQVARYRQRLGRFEHTRTQSPIPCGSPPNVCWETTSVDIGPVAFEDVVNATIPITYSFPIVLDAAHNFTYAQPQDFGTFPYMCEIAEVRADKDGRMLALVKVQITQAGPGPHVTLFPVYRVNAAGQLEEQHQVGIGPYFPPGISPIWAVVDLKAGQVIASTAGPSVTIDADYAYEGDRWSQVDQGSQVVYGHFRTIGGPDAGDHGWAPVTLRRRHPSEAAGPVSQLDLDFGTSIAEPSVVSVSSMTAAGLLAHGLDTALTSAGLLPAGISTSTATEDYVYTCSDSCGVVRLESTMWHHRPAGTLREAKRATSAATAEQVVFVAGRTDFVAGEETQAVVLWQPAVATASVVAPSASGFYFLGSTTGQAALATLYAAPTFDLVGTSLIPFAAPATATLFAGNDLSSSFVLLDSSYLYNVTDLKFYQFEGDLVATAFPETLAAVPDNPVGDYHVIRTR